MPAQIASDSFTFQGTTLETAPEALGPLRRSDDALGDFTELRHRMQQDGYLFLPGLLHRNEILSARSEIARRLADDGLLHESYPIADCIAAPAAQVNFMAEVARDNPRLDAVL